MHRHESNMINYEILKKNKLTNGRQAQSPIYGAEFSIE